MTEKESGRFEDCLYLIFSGGPVLRADSWPERRLQCSGQGWTGSCHPPGRHLFHEHLRGHGGPVHSTGSNTRPQCHTGPRTGRRPLLSAHQATTRQDPF